MLIHRLYYCEGCSHQKMVFLVRGWNQEGEEYENPFFDRALIHDGCPAPVERERIYNHYIPHYRTAEDDYLIKRLELENVFLTNQLKKARQCNEMIWKMVNRKAE